MPGEDVIPITSSATPIDTKIMCIIELGNINFTIKYVCWANLNNVHFARCSLKPYFRICTCNSGPTLQLHLTKNYTSVILQQSYNLIQVNKTKTLPWIVGKSFLLRQLLQLISEMLMQEVQYIFCRRLILLIYKCYIIILNFTM